METRYHRVQRRDGIKPVEIQLMPGPLTKHGQESKLGSSVAFAKGMNLIKHR